MYLRPAFNETDPARIRALIESNPFGLLITHGPRGLDASHIPFVYGATESGVFVLSGHLAAGNPQCDSLEGPALAVFSGPHAYVSPSWYRTHPAVPTWDYAAVHVSGRLHPVSNEPEMEAMLRALSAADPSFDLGALPQLFRDKMMAGIRAFALIPERVEAQWKMSQNRSSEDRRGVISALRSQSDPTAAAVADMIAATLPFERT
jgi:transcriptional regulator